MRLNKTNRYDLNVRALQQILNMKIFKINNSCTAAADSRTEFRHQTLLFLCEESDSAQTAEAVPRVLTVLTTLFKLSEQIM